MHLQLRMRGCVRGADFGTKVLQRIGSGTRLVRGGGEAVDDFIRLDFVRAACKVPGRATVSGGGGGGGGGGGAASRPMSARTVSGGLSEDANVSDVEQVRPVGGAVDADAQDGSGTIRIGMRRIETVRVGDGRGQWGQRGRRRRWGCGRKQSVVLARKRRRRVWQLHVAGGVPIPLRRAECLAAHHIVHGGKGGGVVKVAVCEDLAPRDLLLLPRESDAVIVRVARVLAVTLREQEQVLLSGAAVRQRTVFLPGHRALPPHSRGWRVSPIRVGWRGARHERS